MKLILFCTFLASISFVYGDWIDDLGKCRIGDGSCEKKQFNKAIAHLSDNGDEDLDIPQLDPLELSDIVINTVSGQARFELITGNLKGIKDCEIGPLKTRKDKPGYLTTVDINCPKLVLEGRYKAKAEGTFGFLLSKKVIHGDGDIRVQLDDLFLRLYKPYTIIKDDGELYVDCKNDNNTYGYNYEVKDKMTFKATKVYLVKKDISKTVNKFLNSNWKSIMSAYGEDFFDKIVEIVYKICHRFFDNVPATRYMKRIKETKQ